MTFTGYLRGPRFSPASVFYVLTLICALTLLARANDDQDHDRDDGGHEPHVLYIQSNSDIGTGNNAIMAYVINPTDGSLSLLGIFPTRGTGQANFDVRLGPDDHDREVILSDDKQFLFAVNGGSNTIAVFRVHRDGKLTHVEGSPFPSHGATPISLVQAGDRLVVLNANNNNPAGAPPNELPANYTTFTIRKDGSLEHIPGSIDVPGNSNPVTLGVSLNHKVVFGMEFFRIPSLVPQIMPFLPPRGSVLETFTFREDGSLRHGPGSPYLAPVDARLAPSDPGTGYLLGLNAHPTRPILYAGEPITRRLAVYTYDEDGALHFVTDSPSLGKATCWMAFGKGAQYLYTSDAATNSIGVWNIKNPLRPFTIQELPLRLVGTPPAPVPPADFATVDFQLSLEPSGKWLYITSHAAALTSYPGGNVVHIVKIESDGTVSESSFSPVLLPVPGTVRPAGSAIR